MRNKSSLPVIGGCGLSGTGCIVIIVVALLFGSTCAKYCLVHWLPGIHHLIPAIGLLDPNTSVWSFKLMVLGFFGSELFIPGAIITWLLIGLGIVAA
jgi:hypothetical protein